MFRTVISAYLSIGQSMSSGSRILFHMWLELLAFRPAARGPRRGRIRSHDDEQQLKVETRANAPPAVSRTSLVWYVTRTHTSS
eukprot:scaffold163412_cov16-Prasinocladus_malaysianus.AAC.2